MGLGGFLISSQGTGRDSRGKSWELVRYEELVERPEVAAKGILDFLGVDKVAVDWDRLTKLPVRGSFDRS